jgi:TolA-binding protein
MRVGVVLVLCLLGVPLLARTLPTVTLPADTSAEKALQRATAALQAGTAENDTVPLAQPRASALLAEAEATARWMLQTFPRPHAAYVPAEIVLAKALLAQHYFDEAEVCAMDLALHPLEGVAVKETEVIFSQLEIAAARLPASPAANELLFKLGRDHVQLGHYAQAEPLLHVAHQRLPARADITYQLALALFALGMAEINSVKGAIPAENVHLMEAYALAQSIIDADPNGNDAANGLLIQGRVLMVQMKKADAAARFQRIIDKSPKADAVPQAHAQRYAMAYDDGDFAKMKEAVAQMQRDFPRSPVTCDLMIRLGDYYTNKLHDYPQALNIYQQVLKDFPAYSRASQLLYRVATIHYLQGSQAALAYQNAVDTFLSFIKTYPKDPLADDALYWAAQAELKLNAPGRALTLINQLLVDYPESNIKQQAIKLRDEKLGGVTAAPL